MASHIPQKTLDPHAPFCRADARRAGIPVTQLSSARFRKLFHDVYLDAAVPLTAEVLASAALGISPPGSHASHHTAARIWGGIVPDQPLTHVSCPRGTTRSIRQGVGSHQISNGSRVVTFGGLQVSSPEQTFIDLAIGLSLVDLVVLGDSLVRAGATSTRRLVEAAQGWPGKGHLAAERAALLVRAEVDSPMETRLRLLMVFAGLPEPRINHIVYGARGQWEKRFDLSYPELMVIIEYDGRQHADDDRQYARDIVRREELEGGGWRIIVVRSQDIYVRPGATLERIVNAMRQAGARNLPRTLSSAWERHFPGR
jgi:hypothetical protein